jgi:hypothetical protein
VNADVGLAELRHSRALDGASEIERHQLHAVADPERRHSELVQAGVDPGRGLGVDRRRPTAEDERERVARHHLLRRHRVADELRVDPALAHAARDQLRVLAAEIEHEHGPLLSRRRRDRKAYDLSHQLRR